MNLKISCPMFHGFRPFAHHIGATHKMILDFLPHELKLHSNRLLSFEYREEEYWYMY